MIHPTGRTESPSLAIVGEAPGNEEVRLGVPFAGPSGGLLTMMLSAAGVPKDECYFTTVVKHRPPMNNLGSMYLDPRRKAPLPQLVEAWKDLEAELRAVRPKVIVPLGAEALRAVTGLYSIKNHRGLMITQPGQRVLATYHPNYVLRGMYHERPIVEADLAKAYRQAINPYTPRVSFNVNPTFEDVVRFLSRRDRRLSVDIETFGKVTRMIGFAWDRFNAFVIPFIKGRESVWPPDQEREILFLLSKLLASHDVEKIIQNLNFDLMVLAEEYGFEINNIRMDTMIAHHLLYPELPKGLDFLCSLHTDHHMYWEYDSGSYDSTATYCAYDNVVTYEVADEIELQLKEREMWDFYERILHPGTLALVRIQSRGVLIDQEAREELRKTAQQELKEILHRLHKTAGFELNPWSPKQVSKLIYDTWKLPKQLNNKKKVTTDDDALAILIKKTTVPAMVQIMQDILGCRKKRTYISTFLEMNLRKGRVHTSFNIAGTVTGRLASSATIDDIGGNLQNFPRGEPRKIFVADPGYTLIKADLSQAEYRVLIWKARINRVIDRLLNEAGFNIHMWNASENIFRVPISQVTKKMYNDSKNGVYGSNYGIGPHKVSRMYNIEFKDAKFIIERYHEAVPEVQGVYQSEIREAINTTRELTNPFGRKRLFMGRLDDELYRSAYSHYCQSTVADLITCGMNDLEFSQSGPDVQVLLQVHDELVSQCPTRDIEAGVEKVRTAMERPIEIEGRTLVIPVEIKVGQTWATCVPLKEWRNEQR